MRTSGFFFLVCTRFANSVGIIIFQLKNPKLHGFQVPTTHCIHSIEFYISMQLTAVTFYPCNNTSKAECGPIWDIFKRNICIILSMKCRKTDSIVCNILVYVTVEQMKLNSFLKTETGLNRKEIQEGRNKKSKHDWTTNSLLCTNVCTYYYWKNKLKLSLI